MKNNRERRCSQENDAPHYVTIDVGTSEPQHPRTARDYYRGLYFKALDCSTSALKERINQPAFLVYKKRDKARVTRDAKSFNVHERDLLAK